MSLSKSSLDRRLLKERTAFTDARAAGILAIADVVTGHSGIVSHRPERDARADFREQLPVIASPARLARPHDTDPLHDRPCPICAGQITPPIDCHALSTRRGVTFVTPNLFPVAMPLQPAPAALRASRGKADTAAHPVSGIHLVQWCSTRHDLDLHNLPVADVTVLLERLAALEEALLFDSDARAMLPVTGRRRRRRMHGWMGAIKNYGREVGGSLTHGHQQLAVLSAQPRSVAWDLRFARQHGMPIDEWYRRETPRRLVVARFSGGVRLLVPTAARRPLDALILPGDSKASFLHELSRRPLTGMAEALIATTRALHALMPGLGREVSYNLVFHLHPGAGAHIEVLPFTQEVGGYERLGVYLSHARPEDSHALYCSAIDG